jgi:hypothetical protein
MAGASARAQQASTPVFPMTLHVTSSELAMVPENTSDSVRGVTLLDLLHGTLNGSKLVLAEPVRGGFWAHAHPRVLAPGDYAVRLKQSKQPDPGEREQTYQLRLANGKTRMLFLWGMSD